jgi:hypothetical protein
MPAKYLVSIPVSVERATGEPRVDDEWQWKESEVCQLPGSTEYKYRRTRALTIPVIAVSQNEAERKAQEILTLLVGRAYGSFDGNGSPVKE